MFTNVFHPRMGHELMLSLRGPKNETDKDSDICFMAPQEAQRPPRRQDNPPRICVAFVKLVCRKTFSFHCSVVVAVISAVSSSEPYR